MTKALLCLCITVFHFSTQVKAQEEFKLKGEITGLENDSVYIFLSDYSASGERQISDTIALIADKGKFKYTGTIASPQNVYTLLGGVKSRKNFSMFLEKGNISIIGDINDADRIAVTGTTSNNDQFKVRNYTNAIYNRIKSLRETLKTFSPESDSYKLRSADIEAKFDSIKSYELAFIKSHPASYYSSILLWVKQDWLPIDELEKLYLAFPLPVQNSGNGIAIRNKIAARKFVAVGMPAPDFTSEDTSGNPVALSSFKGKYVMLEFWANWCVPCREQHPHLVEMYNKYKDKGFTIVQYSIDDNAAAQKWKAAIIKDGLVWTQASDLAGFESKVAKMYGVQPIPDNFLIDPNGIIIGRRLQGKALEDKLEAYLK